MSGHNEIRHVKCGCGQVILETTGSPIMTVACYCESCQQAAHSFQLLPGAPDIVDGDGGTPFVMCRKDRVRFLHGQENLRGYRLKPESATRRVIAQCCNSPMFLEFEKGHWLSLYRDRFAPEDRPALEMRTMTMDRRPGVSFNDAIPSPKKHTAKFMWNLMSAWIAMGFKVPKIEIENVTTRSGTERVDH